MHHNNLINECIFLNTLVIKYNKILNLLNKIFIVVLLVIYSHNVKAQQNTAFQKDSRVKLNKEYFKSYLYDTKDAAAAAFHWDKKQWITCSAVIGTGILIYTQDEQIKNFVQRNRTKTGDKISKYMLEPIGNGMYSLPLLGILYVKSTFNKDYRLEYASLTAIKALIISSLYAQLIKQISHRHRPYQDIESNSENWDGPFSNFKYTSFPSAHTVSAFSVATIFALTYKNKKKVQIVSYSLAALTALSRLNDNKHWASDVFFGAALGYSIGKLIYNNSSNKLEIIPYSLLKENGVQLVLHLN